MPRPTVSLPSDLPSDLPSEHPITDDSMLPDRPRRRAEPMRAHHLLSRLQLEWDRLVRSPESLRRARSWDLPVESFESLDTLLRSIGLGVARTDQRADDAALGALVAIARDDELAARVVLQRLLPGVSAIVRRRRSFTAQLDATDELLAAMWTVIRTYPIERRPHFVAAGLLRAADYAAFQRQRRRLAVHVPRPTWTFDLHVADEPGTAASDELAELLEMGRRAGMEHDDLDLAERLGRGESTLQIAAARRVTDRTIRNHRIVVAHRLRTVALAAG